MLSASSSIRFSIQELQIISAHAQVTSHDHSTQLNSDSRLSESHTHTQPKLHLYATQDTLFQDRNRDAIHTPISSKYEDVPCLPFIFHFILDFQKTYQIFKI